MSWVVTNLEQNNEELTALLYGREMALGEGDLKGKSSDPDFLIYTDLHRKYRCNIKHKYASVPFKKIFSVFIYFCFLMSYKQLGQMENIK